MTLSAVAAVLSLLALLVATGLVPGVGGPDLDRRVHAFLLKNPETVVDALKAWDASQQAAQTNEVSKVLTQRKDEIFNDPAAPVGGNPNGDVTLVEFFDYNCPYCRKAAPMLSELQRADLGLRLVFKEFPILGPGSSFAAKAALASQKQGKYLAFHEAMMTYKGAITESSALEVAASVGLEVERLKKDMQDPAIDQAVQRNLALANALRLSGTPGFVAGKEVVRSLIDIDSMKRLIAAARKE